VAKPIRQAIVAECKLLEYDPDGDTSVWIRQARAHEEAQRDRLWAKTMIERDTAEGTYREIYDLPGMELVSTECWLTFEDANILMERAIGKGKDGEDIIETYKLFRKGMSQSEFKDAFGKLPMDLIMEWHAKVREINYHWAPGGKMTLEKN
jgi:hypothetical protein